MPSPTSYNFVISTSFPNGLASDRLSDEISKSGILTGLQRIDTIGNTCYIWFKGPLSTGDQTTLNSLVAVHSGEPYPPIAQPVSFSSQEEQYTLIGSMYSQDTNSDQVILSYTVPDDKTFYLLGYTVTGSGSSSSQIKIGKLPLGSEPVSPGSYTSHLFRCFSLEGNASTGDVDLSGLPRRIAQGGETIVMVVTPSSKSKTKWSGVIDFVLR